MGLDTCIYRIQKMDTSYPWTDTEVYTKFDPKGDNYAELLLLKPVSEDPNFTIEGSDGYLFKCVCQIYDYDKMMAKLGISKEDGWEYYGGGSDADSTPKNERPPEDKVEWWFTFVNKHGLDNLKDWEYKEIPALIGDNDLTKLEENWCILTIGKALADMRKGANEQFYKDGQWDDLFCPICSKHILKEHMEKYFDDAPDPWYYKNCRDAFRKTIFDKFEDGKGLCVIYC